MIDTIVLTLSQDTYTIIEPDAFVPSARWAGGTFSLRGMQSKQNPTRKELLEGIYKPRLTLSNRFAGSSTPALMLKIELSLPKLLYGNNFNELQLKDFIRLTQKLAATLESMGVQTTPQALAQAPVSAIHYSKNIALTDGSTPYHYIQKIKESNIKLSLDVNQTDYRNEGHSYKWHSNSYEVAFYDKIRDLEKGIQSSKRTLEKDSALQLSLLDGFKKRKNLEFLRMEVRLNKRQKIKTLFAKLGIKSDLTFKGLFKPAISKKVLLHYLDEIESKRPALLDFKATNDKALMTALLLNNPDLKPKRIFQLYGLKKAFDTFNLRELRGMFGKCHQRNWYRLMAEARDIKLPGMLSPFSVIREQLIRFKRTNSN